MPTDYKDIINLFIELRARGISLSAFDLEILERWSLSNINPILISKVMIELQEECLAKKKNFPNTLEPISRQVNKVLIKMRET